MKSKNHTSHPIIRQVSNQERSYGSSIMKVARHFHHVRADSRILEVADALQDNPDILVIAIVDAAGRPTGYITREHLFSTLGKPYGRDILSRSLIAELSSSAPLFSQHANLFTVVEAVEFSEHDHFLLIDAEGLHVGMFTSYDMMSFLSRMTQEDISMAGRLQERMIGGSVRHQGLMGSGSGWDLHGWCHPAKGVGGDFYVAKELADGKWFVTLCDVSGKGVAASVLSSMVWGMMSMYDFRHGLKNLISRLNEAVIATFQLERYLTGVFMLWDPATSRLQWADMGHSHLVISRDGCSRFLQGKRANLPIGLEQGIDPLIWALQLKPGDRLTAFTDGITEQENPAEQEFGETRLFQLLDGTAHGCLADQIPGLMDAWRQTIPQQDDMSFLMLELT